MLYHLASLESPKRTVTSDMTAFREHQRGDYPEHCQESTKYVEFLERKNNMSDEAPGLYHPKTIRKWHTKPMKPPRWLLRAIRYQQRKLNWLVKETLREECFSLHLPEPIKQWNNVSVGLSLMNSDNNPSEQLSPFKVKHAVLS